LVSTFERLKKKQLEVATVSFGLATCKTLVKAEINSLFLEKGKYV
jgi:hypothetical protein